MKSTRMNICVKREIDREDQAAIPQLKSFKEAIASLEQVQHFWNAMK